jgi:hypothetical protein
VALTPSIINIGQVKPRQSVTKTVLVRSSQPFSITEMKASEDALQSVVKTAGAKPVHQVTLTLKAPDRPGPFHSTLTVKTDVPDEPAAVLKTFATVGP